MLLFDTPSREICTIKRPRTNTPLQALTLLNDVTYVEAARVLAERMLKEGSPTPGDRIAHGFRLATLRWPSAAERTVLTSGFERRLARFRADLDAARELIRAGESKADPSLDAAELAAYTMTASLILNLDETITKE
jgi:hypothetical protein